MRTALGRSGESEGARPGGVKKERMEEAGGWRNGRVGEGGTPRVSSGPWDGYEFKFL